MYINRAQDSLPTQRQDVSIDGIRIALDNICSKTTIRRYPKEHEGEEDTLLTRTDSLALWGAWRRACRDRFMPPIAQRTAAAFGLAAGSHIKFNP